MKKVILLAISIVFFTSCEKEIEFNGEQSDPKLVVNSLVEVGRPVSASISKSFFFLDNNANTLAPNDTEASLYVNGILYGLMTQTYDTLMSYDTWNPNDPSLARVRKVFVSDYCPQVGDIVKITASAQGFEDVEGITSALPSPTECQLADETIKEIESYYMDYDEDSALYVYGQLDLLIEVTDPNPGKTDLFRISIQRDDYDGDAGYGYYSSSYYVSPEFTDPVFGGSIESNEFFDASDLDTRPQGVFTDALFDGGSYQIKVPVYFNLTKFDATNPDFFKVPITVEHLSKEYYYYLNTCEQGEAGFQIWAEPIQTYSNVKGGYGIVGGRATDVMQLALPLEEP